MRRAATRIADLEVLGCPYSLRNLQRCGLRVIRHEILHRIANHRIRVQGEPQPTQGVLHQILHDPVRREKLCCCRYVLRRDLHIPLQVLVNCVLLLRDIELVEPADDLDTLLAVRIGHRLAHLGQDRILREEVVWHQDLRPVVDLAEEKRHRPSPCVASGDKQESIRFAKRIRRGNRSGQNRLHALLLLDIQPQAVVEHAVPRLGQHLGLSRARDGRNDHDRRVAVCVHEAERAEAVEPGVGRLLDNRLRPPCIQLPLKAFDGHAMIAAGRALLGQRPLDLVPDDPAKRRAGLPRKPFQRTEIHRRSSAYTSTRLPFSISARMAEPSAFR